MALSLSMEHVDLLARRSPGRRWRWQCRPRCSTVSTTCSAGSVQIVQVAAVQVDLDTAAAEGALMSVTPLSMSRSTSQGREAVASVICSWISAAPAGTLIGQQYIIGKGSSGPVHPCRHHCPSWTAMHVAAGHGTHGLVRRQGPLTALHYRISGGKSVVLGRCRPATVHGDARAGSLPISGIMTMPMRGNAATLTATSRPIASPRGRALTFRQKRSGFLVAVQQLVKAVGA